MEGGAVFGGTVFAGATAINVTASQQLGASRQCLFAGLHPHPRGRIVCGEDERVWQLCEHPLE